MSPKRFLIFFCPTEIEWRELAQPDTNMWNMEITEGQIKSNYQPCIFVCPAIRAHVLSFRVHNKLKNFSRSVSLPRARPSECHPTIGLQSFQWDFKLNSMAQEIDTRIGMIANLASEVSRQQIHVQGKSEAREPFTDGYESVESGLAAWAGLSTEASYLMLTFMAFSACQNLTFYCFSRAEQSASRLQTMNRRLLERETNVT